VSAVTVRRSVIVLLTFLSVLGTCALAVFVFLASNSCLNDNEPAGYVCEHPSATRVVLWNVAAFALPPVLALGCGIWAARSERWAPMIGVFAAPVAVVLLAGALEP
jgi:hypothetical protein